MNSVARRPGKSGSHERLDESSASTSLHDNGTPLAVTLAHNPQEVIEAQRLRYKVFAEETGARMPGVERAVDSDFYDTHCDHLLARDAENRIVAAPHLDDARTRVGARIAAATHYRQDPREHALGT